MARRRAGFSSKVYDRRFPDIDDVDHMAYEVQRRAVAQRERSVEGLLKSLAHIASHEEDAIDDIVIDPELVDDLAESTGARDREIVARASEELRRWLDGEDSGKRQRARYALVRFEGPASALVASGLGGAVEAQIAVIRALADPLHESIATEARRLRFSVLPAELLPHLRPLFSPKAVKRRARGRDGDGADWRDSTRVLRLLLRIESAAASEEVHAVLLAALEDDEFRPLLQQELLGGGLSDVRMPASPAVRERFERGAAILDGARKAGLPSRVEIAVLGALAAFVRRDEIIARRTVGIFDLIGSAVSPEVVVPFVELLVGSVDLLGPDDLVKLAAFMTREPEQRLPAAAAAWVRVDPAKAKELARRFNDGEKARVDKRWLAAARAHMAWAGRRAEIAALIPETALGAALGDAPSEIARPILESLIRKARNFAELTSAVVTASARGEKAVLGAVLEKIRDTPFRVDGKMEGLLVALMGPENEDDVRIEIDGENPFRDRREALGRALAAALGRGRSR